MVTGIVGFFVLPILFGPVAIVAGAVGHHTARQRDASEKASLIGLLLGVLSLCFGVFRMGLLP
ncbi:MAG: hypothetical protein ABS81_15175 [Pseudonocardia sp. SCN 72-86]|nr:MAG: hypothetical protein ABS81_15175 [Pseudonocardia sp. SCN 72-86]